MNTRKTIRLLAASFAVLALLAFSTVVVSDFDCHNAADDTRCPYCHLAHQAPAEPEVTHSIIRLEPIASLPLPADFVPLVIQVLSPTAPRAPPLHKPETFSLTHNLPCPAENSLGAEVQLHWAAIPGC
jgi:hypothetical protein